MTGYTHLKDIGLLSVYRRTGKLDRNTPRFFVHHNKTGLIVLECGRYSSAVRWARKHKS